MAIQNPEKTALLLIDVQKEYLLAGRPLQVPDAPKIIDRLVTALALWHQKGWPVVHIHHEEPEGSALFARGSIYVHPHRALAIRPTDLRIIKSRPGAFFGTDLEAQLRDSGVTGVLIGGFMTQLCCDSTAREAAARGFEVFFPTDTTSCPPLKDGGFGPLTPAQVKAQVHTVMRSFATVAPLDELLPGQPEFKA